MDAIVRDVGVRMVDGPLDRRENKDFVGGQVQLDARGIARTTKRAAVAHTALRRLATARVPEDFELARLGRELKAADVVDPIADLLEDIGQETLVEVFCVLQREVEVFREADRKSVV